MKFNPIGHFDPNLPEVDIVGAGISGLSLSYFLSQKGYKVNLYEKTDRISGKILSEKTPYGIVEKAANTLLLNSELKDVLDEIDLSYVEAVPKLKKQIWLETKKLGLFGKLKLIIKVLANLSKKVPNQSASLQQFFSPLLGEYYAKELVSTVLGGIYGVGSHLVSPLNMLPLNDPYFTQRPRSYFELFKFIKNQTPGKRTKKMISFENGMEDLPKKFYEQTTFNIVKFNHTYELNLNQKKNIILCTNALQASEILKQIQHPLGDILSETSYQALDTTTYFLSQPIPSLKNSFGMLFSPNSNFYSLGVLSRSEIFNLPNQNSYNFISNGLISAKLVSNDLKSIDNKNQINFISRSKWKEAIPIMDDHQFSRLNKMKESIKEETKNIMLFSHYLGGVSIRDIILSAKEFCSKL